MAPVGQALPVWRPGTCGQREQALPHPARPPGALGALVAEPDRQPVLHRSGGEPTVPPHPAQLADLLIQRAVPGGEVRAEQPEFRYPVPGSQAQLQPAPADEVEYRKVLSTAHLDRDEARLAAI